VNPKKIGNLANFHIDKGIQIIMKEIYIIVIINKLITNIE